MITRRTKRILNALTILTVLGFAACVDVIAWHPWFDDGPFHGETRRDISGLPKPQQVFRACAGGTLEVYARRAPEQAPTIVVRNQRGTVASAFFASAPNSLVDSIELTSKRCPNWTGERIIQGNVRWTYGEERALFFLRSDDTIRHIGSRGSRRGAEHGFRSACATIRDRCDSMFM